MREQHASLLAQDHSEDAEPPPTESELQDFALRLDDALENGPMSRLQAVRGEVQKVVRKHPDAVPDTLKELFQEARHITNVFWNMEREEDPAKIIERAAWLQQNYPPYRQAGEAKVEEVAGGVERAAADLARGGNTRRR